MLFGANDVQALDLDDIYIIIYTSNDGRTGHVGMAVDNYDLFVSDESAFGSGRYDSVRNYTMTYYDLWGPKNLKWHQHNDDFKARYHTLTQSNSSERVDGNFLIEHGMPHKYNYPADAVIKIGSTPDEDFRFKEIINEVILNNPNYNTRNYNCTDFVIKSLEKLFEIDFINKEFIPFSWSSTPNSFYKELVQKLDVEILIDPGNKVEYSFFKERIIKSL